MAKKGRIGTIKNGVTSSIYIDASLRDIAKFCKWTDGDIYTTGILTKLQSSNSVQALNKILEIKKHDLSELTEEINRIEGMLGRVKTVMRIRVKEYASGDITVINESEFDKNHYKFIELVNE